MPVMTIDLDQRILDDAKRLTGARSDREVVQRALETLVAVRRQPAAVERIIARDHGFHSSTSEEPHSR
ncbi:type II toxin-antitoxin system VapB family antitoxin [Curtobacterium sp. MCLR17_036]|uniref:type II toxin-antitoxin system VapB family antitoxin n=1 Tax=Curtobacterium sp. MCLR17_036 TaxID=2175620 RepID=UPI000DAA24B0|nr:type II toxin-antitoxin system VapB family antitoxin [Curtobacterium sp. MCLR17_036]WIE64392.1 type II toxin-antitoxin system VapB family antitoxin [Curtobacterium sp. MCLR17_036]